MELTRMRGNNGYAGDRSRWNGTFTFTNDAATFVPMARQVRTI